MSRNEVLIATAVLAAVAAAAPAQQQFAELGTRGLPPNDTDTWAVALGDVDGDGDGDLVVGTSTQDHLYLNDGKGNYTDVTATHLPSDINATRGIALGDVDGDGDLDIVLAIDLSQNRLYLNDGNGVFTDVTLAQMPTEQEHTYAVDLGDVDGDGDLDIVFGNGPYGFSSVGQELLYLNDGNGFFTDATAGRMPPDTNVTLAVALGDVDGDGDLDIVLGITKSTFPTITGQNKLYLNNGDGVFTDATASRMPTDNQTTSAVLLGDVDGDSDLDIIIGNSSYGLQDRLYLNNGDGEFTDVTGKLMPVNEYRTMAMALGDADGDGDLDLVLATSGQPSPQNRLYLNNGTGDFHDMTLGRLPADDDFTRAVTMGDVDGDGDADIVFGNRNTSIAQDQVQDRIHLNNGSATFVDGATARLPDSRDDTSVVVLGDVDGDGDLDLALGNHGPSARSQNRLYINNGDGIYADETAARLPVFINDQSGALVLGDVDGDGDLDMVVGNSQVQNRLHLNDGTGTFTDATAGRMPIESDATTAIALGDIDGDGDLDMVCGNAPVFFIAGPNRLYVNDGTGFFIDDTAARLPVEDYDNTASVALGDVDGGGDLDIVIGNSRTPLGNPGQQNRLYLNDGSGFFTDATAGRMPTDTDYTSSIVLGDVDGDGDLDMVLGNTYVAAEQNKLYLNDGTGTFSDVTAARLPTRLDNTSGAALGDVDNDGDLDILFGNFKFSLTGQNRLYLNDGAGTFTDATTPRLPEAEDKTAAVALGDVDGDGDLDIVLGNSVEERNRLYLNLLRQLDAPLRLRIGDNYTLDAYARYGPPSASDIAVPFLSGGRASIPFPPLGTIGLDPLLLVALPPFLIPQPAGVGSLVRPIPNVPGLASASIHTQAVLVQNPFPARLTNVLSDTVIQ